MLHNPEFRAISGSPGDLWVGGSMLELCPIVTGAVFTGALDTFVDDLNGAWSVARRLLASYTGPLIGVRRGSDDAEDNFGYDSNGNLDSAALLSFAGSEDVFVHTVYDQSGQGFNFEQGEYANQPRIVNSGVLETNEGKPALRFDGVNDGLIVGSFPILGQWWGYIVSKRLATGSNPELWALVSYPDTISDYRLWESSGANIYYNNSTGGSSAIPYSNGVTYAHLLKGAEALRYAKSSAGDTIDDASDNTLLGGVPSTIGFRNDNGQFLNGFVSEWALCFDTISEPAEAALWANLNSMFSTPIP